VNIAVSDIPLKTRFFGLHFTRRMYRCIFNHFYVIKPQSYQMRRNNVNYTAITSFKVIQGHLFWYQATVQRTISSELRKPNHSYTALALALVANRKTRLVFCFTKFRKQHTCLIYKSPCASVCKMTDTENVIGVGDLCKKDTYARTDFNAQLFDVTCLVY